MMRDVGARFVQSAGEFPLSVGLGKKGPSWELRRWGRDVLRFSPLVEGGFSTRGDRRRVHYKGDGVSHRFTILDNEHFEYDVILNKEPESNRLYLAIQGWEGFDFFRQPDDIGPDMLRGSYAVYKKEGVINAPAYHVGTGKICHIHRPRIIDARGRRVWGDIWIDRGLMTMIIPEWWLADAKYPVVVDPVVGSNVAGAYNSCEYMTQLDYQRYSRDKRDDPSVLLESYANARPLEFATGVVFNKYTLPARLGWCNTFLYIEKVPVIQNYSYDDYGVVPLLYDDDNNHPKYSLNYESWFASILGLSSPSSFTPQWIQSEITADGYIAEDTEVWFGHFGRNGAMRFDYGAPFFQSYEYIAHSLNTGESDDSFIMAFDWDLYDISYMAEQQSGIYKNVYPGARYDMKVSMYLTFTARYNRTVNQWVMPTEIRQLTGKYQRNAEQTVWGAASVNRFEGFCRRVEDVAVSGGVALRQLFVFLRLLTGAYIRDYIIGRFLKSKEELIIKSPVEREVGIDSRIR